MKLAANDNTTGGNLRTGAGVNLTGLVILHKELTLMISSLDSVHGQVHEHIRDKGTDKLTFLHPCPRLSGRPCRQTDLVLAETHVEAGLCRCCVLRSEVPLQQHGMEVRGAAHVLFSDWRQKFSKFVSDAVANDP